MQTIQFRVQQVEGPLDLILQLLQKHKLNIYDIEISSLLEQYLAAIDEMRERKLEISSEFLEMASRLVNIKTAMLLPRHSEDEPDPRLELTGALLEYQACKQAAEYLRGRMVQRYTHPAAVPEIDPAYARIHIPEELLRAYHRAIGRKNRRLPPPREAFAALVSHRIVPVSARITFVLGQLYRCGHVALDKLFLSSADRPELVATFLAVLELVLDKRARLDQTGELMLTHPDVETGGTVDAI